MRTNGLDIGRDVTEEEEEHYKVCSDLLLLKAKFKKTIETYLLLGLERAILK
jgi:hypothetical protein